MRLHSLLLAKHIDRVSAGKRSRPFVITMTITRMHGLVSRIVRLYTSYWAEHSSTFKLLSLYHVELINPFIKAAVEDHTNADCLIVVAMSHGESGLLHSTDSLYPVDMLWTPFTGDRCTSLAGKPKLFFIQVR